MNITAPNIIERTVWALGVPVPFRPSIEAAMPEHQFHFITVMQPLRDRTARIIESQNPVVATWGQTTPLDYHLFVRDNRIQTGTLGMGGIITQGTAKSAPWVPYGFYLDLDTSPSLRLLRDSDQSSAAATTVQAVADSFARLGITLFQKGGVIPPMPRTSKKTVLIVADDHIPGLKLLSPSRFKAYENLAVQARAEYPSHYIIFLSNGDIEVPTELGMRIASEVSIVIHAPYSPAYLTGAEVVMVNESTAGLDAAIRGKTVIAAGDALVQALVAGTISIPEAFARRFINGIRFVDPEALKPISPIEAGQLALARTRALQAPVALPTTEWRPIPAYANNPIPIKYPASPMAKPLTGGAVLAAPDWLTNSEVVAGSEGILYLAHDGDRIDASVIEDLTALRTANWSGANKDKIAQQISKFTWQYPEVTRRLFQRHLAQVEPKAVALFDLGDPAVRLLARTSVSLNIPRILCPINTLGANPAEWPYRMPFLDWCHSLIDYAVVWEENQKAALIDRGFPADRIREARAPIRNKLAVGGGKTLVAILTNGYFKVTKHDLGKFINVLIDATSQLDLRLDLAIGGAEANLLTDDFIARVLLSDNTRLLVKSIDFIDVQDILSNARWIVTDSERVAHRAVAADRLAFLLTYAHLPIVGAYARPEEAIAALLTAMDEDSRALAITGFEGAASISDALRAVAQDRPSSRGLPLDNVLAGRPFPVAEVTSSVLDAEWTGIQRYVSSMLGIRSRVRTGTKSAVQDIFDTDFTLQWGTRISKSKSAIELLRRKLQRGRLTLEDGFLRSVEIGLAGVPTLSVVMDDISVFYDATQPSRLENLLNGRVSLTIHEIERVRILINRIQETKVTKYNFAPYRRLKMPDTKKKRLLLVDQRAGDQAIVSGLADDRSFRRMLTTALEMTLEYDVIIKTHPDANIGGKESAIGKAGLDMVADHPSVFLFTEDVNPYALIDIVDTVFVVTSGMGFEALLAGKEVHCFGAPFYAGWGLTQDKVKIERRKATRTLEEVFHIFYITLSRYFDPRTGGPGEIENVIDYLVDSRPWVLDYEEHASEDPATNNGLLELPCRDIATQNINKLWVVGVSGWKRNFFRIIFKGCSLTFLDTNQDFLSKVGTMPIGAAFVVWGKHPVPGLNVLARKFSAPILRVEDGFIRSVGLGSDRIPPYSLCIDSRGIYFDATSPSDLEVILQNYDFAQRPELLQEARELIDMLIAYGVSKYNFAYPRHRNGPYGPKHRKRILVIGQVEDDASIKFGAATAVSNNDLVRLARSENPDAEVIYKIHPDVLAGKRGRYSDPADVADISRIFSEPLSLHDAFYEVDHVYSITSLAGFEALLRGIRVTTIGTPFYSGWGLTDDRQPCERRTRKRSLEEVFAGAYLLYAKYFSPANGTPFSLREVIDLIILERGEVALIDDLPLPS